MLLALGLALMVLGAVLVLGGKLGLGKLPGDLHWHGRHGSFYFPVVTCLLLSVVATLVANLWWSRR